MLNKPFKDEVGSLFEDHLDKNLDQYLNGKINVSQRRVLMKKWVGEAWSKVGKMKDSIARSLKKCGLSVALDGSDEVNIEGLSEYQMPSAFVQDNEYVLDDDDESEKEDEDKGNVENEEGFEILIPSDIPIVTE